MKKITSYICVFSIVSRACGAAASSAPELGCVQLSNRPQSSALSLTTTAIAQRIVAARNPANDIEQAGTSWGCLRKIQGQIWHQAGEYRALRPSSYTPLLLTSRDNFKVGSTGVVEQGNAQIMQLMCAQQDMRVDAFRGESVDSAADLRDKGYTDYSDLNSNPFRECRGDKRFNAFLQKLRQGYENDMLRQNRAFNDASGSVIIGGGGGSCGYQVIKNALALTEALKMRSDNEQQRLLQQITSIPYVSHLCGLSTAESIVTQKNVPGVLRARALRFGRETGFDQTNFSAPDGDWISREAVHRLYEKTPLHGMYGVPLINYLDSSNDDRNALIAEVVRHKEKRSALAMFLLLDQPDIRTAGHYYLLAVHTHDGKHDFVIMDSTNKPRYNDSRVQDIVLNFTGVEGSTSETPGNDIKSGKEEAQ